MQKHCQKPGEKLQQYSDGITFQMFLLKIILNVHIIGVPEYTTQLHVSFAPCSYSASVESKVGEHFFHSVVIQRTGAGRTTVNRLFIPALKVKERSSQN